MNKQMGNMMKQMQENMQKMQDNLQQLEVIGEAGGGMVKVTLNGKNEARRVEIDDTLIGDDKDVLEDLIAAAFNAAVRKVEAATQEATASSLGGMLPPGMKMPF